MHLSTLCVLAALCLFAALSTVDARVTENDVRYGRYSSRIKHWIYNRWNHYKRIYERRNKIRSRGTKDMFTYMNKELLKVRFRNYAHDVMKDINKLNRNAKTRDYKRIAESIGKNTRPEIESYYKTITSRNMKAGKYHQKMLNMPVSKLDTTNHIYL